MNTGLGASADIRTSLLEELQRTLIRELHYGILAPVPKSTSPEKQVNGHVDGRELDNHATWGQGLALEDPIAATCMPEAWVRAAILIRINSLVSGHSGIRPQPIERMADLLTYNITPRILIHGSI